MRHTVTEYVKTCKVCQQDKNRTTLANGLLQPHDIPQQRWHTISLDFITALPLTPSGHNAILVVTDKLTKMSHFIATDVNVTAEQTAQLFIDNVFKLHGVPRKIISDRGAQFTSLFWTTLWKLLGTKLNISTAYHPQTDGQTERTNQTLESIIRHYVHWNESTWHNHLAIVEFAYNNATSTATKYSPFQLMYGDNPQAPVDVLFNKCSNPTVSNWLVQIQTSLVQARDNIRRATDVYTQRVNYSRLDITFKEGEMVLLNTDNLSLQAPDVSRRFVPKYIGPFKVTKVISPVAYQLELPETMRCHPVFHIDRLQPYHESDNSEFPGREHASRPLPPVEAPAPEYEVAAVVDRCWRETGKPGTKQYKCWREWLVQWKHIDQQTWEKQAAFVNKNTVNEVFQQYELNHPYSDEDKPYINKYDKNRFTLA
jgi:hypothetical protein